MASNPELLDLFVSALQAIAVLYLAYGAYLAARRVSEPENLDAPTAASATNSYRHRDSGQRQDLGDFRGPGEIQPTDAGMQGS